MSNAVSTTGTLVKRRAGPAAITSITVANPTHIFTNEPHGLISGNTYTIAGTTTTPTVVGARVVTVVSPREFTVPVNVTVGQSSPAGTIAEAAFVTIAEIIRTGLPGWSRNKIETSTHNDGTESYILGILRQKDPTFAVNYLANEATHVQILNDMNSGAKADWQFALPSGVLYTGPARVQQFTPLDAPVDAAQQAEVTLTWSGPVVQS
jgi:hypothetical protein